MIDPAEVDSAIKRWRQSPEFRDYAKAVHTALSGDAGARALEYLAGLLDANTYAPGDPYHSAFLAGRRSVLLHIQALRQVAADPPELPKLDL